MRVFHWVAGTIVAAILTLVVTAWLSTPINNYFRNDRLVGKMLIGPSAERPTLKPQKSDGKKSPEQLLAELSEGLKNLSRYSGQSFANVSLENNSDKVVSNIRFKFDGYSADVLLDDKDDAKDVYLPNVEQFDVPDMKPGDTLTYRMWIGTDSPELIRSGLHTYSSSGPVRMSFSWPDAMEEFPESGLEKAFEDWGDIAIFGLMSLLILILSIVAFGYEGLLKKMFRDPELYRNHKDRFEADPTKYNPFEVTKPKKDQP